MTAAVLGDNTNATLGGASDTWIQETAPTANRNADAIVNVTDWTAGDRKRAVLEFPTAGLPAGITISAGATLELWLTSNPGGGNNSLSVWELLRAFVDSQATWNEYSTGNAWATAGGKGTGDITATAVASNGSVGNAGLGTYVKFSGAGLDTLIQAKVAAGTPIRLLAGFTTEASVSEEKVFTSDTGTDGQRPRIVFEYTTGASTKPAWAGLYGRGGGRDLVRLNALLPTSKAPGFIGANALFGGAAPVALTGAAVAAALATGALSKDVPLAGAATAAGAATGALTQAVPIAGAALAAGLANGGLSISVRLAAAALGGALASAQMALGVPLAGAALGAGLASGGLVSPAELAGAAAGSGAAAGNLSKSAPLAGAAVGSAQAAATLTVQISLSGAALAQALASGSLTKAVTLAGGAQGAALAAGELLGGASLAGAAQGSAQAAGAINVQVRLTAAASGSAQAAATLTLAVPLSAQAVAAAIAGGALSVQVRLSAAAIASALAGGSLSTGGVVLLQAAALGAGVASGNLSALVALYLNTPALRLSAGTGMRAGAHHAQFAVEVAVASAMRAVATLTATRILH